MFQLLVDARELLLLPGAEHLAQQDDSLGKVAHDAARISGQAIVLMASGHARLQSLGIRLSQGIPLAFVFLDVLAQGADGSLLFSDQHLKLFVEPLELFVLLRAEEFKVQGRFLREVGQELIDS